jgi:hypothetical protein
LTVDFNRLMYSVNDIFDQSAPVFAQVNFPAGQNLLESQQRNQLERSLTALRRLNDPEFRRQCGTGEISARQDMLTSEIGALLNRRLGAELLVMYRADYQLITRIHFARLATALVAYYADQGEYPPNLDVLAPRYMRALPVDPFNKEPFHYRKEEKRCLIWSVGFNGTDNQGNPEQGKDIVMQMALPPKHSP